MITTYEFVWIDDNPDRVRSWENAFVTEMNGETFEAEVTNQVVTSDFLTEIDGLCQDAWANKPPRLIMLDQDLRQVPNRAFDMHGSALAHLLRLRLPVTPIVCVSGQTVGSSAFTAEDISEYTYMFELGRLSTPGNIELLFAIAKDFEKLVFPAAEGVRQKILEILSPPDVDKNSLANILPPEFSAKPGNSVSAHRIARWILNVFMKRQGFLCDTLEAATLLGLTEEAFVRKAKHHFDLARYVGPFSTNSHPLWWTSTFIDVLYDKLPDQISKQPFYAGRFLDDILESDYSQCGVTGERVPAPDVVAFVDDTSASPRMAVQHIHTTALSEEADAILGFTTALKIKNIRAGDA